MNELEEELKGFLIAKAAEVLKRETDEISWEDDMDEYGFDSMGVNQFCVELNIFFAMDINPALFLEVTSLEALSQHLRKIHYLAIEDKLL